MATDVETLRVQMDLDIARYQQNLEKVLNDTRKGMSELKHSIDAAFGDAPQRWADQTSTALVSVDTMASAALIGMTRLAGIATAVFTVDGIIEASKAYDHARLSISFLGQSAEASGKDLERITRMAEEQGQPVDVLAKYYQRLAASQSMIHTSGAQLLEFEDAVIHAFRASGLSASQASGQMDGMISAFRGGKVEMGLFNSLLDSSPNILRAVASGMVEAGGSVDKLRTLVDEGKISGEAFFKAFLAGKPTIEAMAPATSEFGEAVTRMKNSVGEAGSALEELAATEGSISEFFGTIDKMARAAADGIRIARDESTKFADIIPRTNAFGIPLDTPVMDRNGVPIRAAAPKIEVEDRAYIEAIPRPRPLSPIKASDYPVKDKGDKGGSDDGEGAFDKANKSLEKRIEDLALEQEMLGKSTMEREKAKASLDLMRAAEEEEIPITDELKKKIEASAEAYAIQADAVKTAKDEMAQMKELQTFIGTSMSSFFSDITSGGRNAEQAIMHLTKKLTDMALQAVLLGSGSFAGLFGMKGDNGNVGGLIGAMFGSFKFAEGGVMGPGGPMPLHRYASGGVATMPQLAMFGEGAGPEAYVPLPDGRNIPVSLRLPQIQSQVATSAGAMTVYNIDARGADQVAIAKLQAQIVAMKRDAGAAVDHRVQVNRIRGTRS